MGKSLQDVGVSHFSNAKFRNHPRKNPGVSKLLASLKECSRLKDLKRGLEVHSEAISSGLFLDSHVVTSLINMYAKCKSMRNAQEVFDKAGHKDVVTWTALITGYAGNEECDLALRLFDEMEEGTFGCVPNERTLVAALSACAILASDDHRKNRWLEKGKIIHMRAVMNCCRNVFVNNKLIDLYAKCMSMVDARGVFDEMTERNVVSWTTLLQGYADNGEYELVLDMFDDMEKEGCVPDARVYVVVISSCAALAVRRKDGKAELLLRGKKMHSKAVLGNCCEIYVKSALVDMYGKCGSVVDAHEVFDGMEFRDVVSWTALIQACVDNGENELGLKVFNDMCKLDGGCFPNSRTYVAALSACAGVATKLKGGMNKCLVKENETHDLVILKKCLEKGKEIHDSVVLNKCCNIYVQNTLIDMYAKYGSMVEARSVFDKMIQRDLVSWNSLAGGYVENGENEIALETIICMEAAPDSLTFMTALAASGNLMGSRSGKFFHGEICRCGLEQDVVLANCLIDFYGKCGSLADARRLFDSNVQKTFMTWTSLMFCYSVQGDTECVFELFKDMEEESVPPNEVTFACVLSACSHSGEVEKGRKYFDVMERKYGVRPNIIHYSCLVDLLGRANCIDEAVRVLKSMPFEANAVIWRAVLGACEKWNNAVLGKVAYEALLELDQSDGSAYVLMSNIDSTSNTHESARKIWSSRSPVSLRNQTLWTDESGKVHKFVEETSNI